MVKHLNVLLLFLLVGKLLSAQMPKAVVVEHFTNTRCSVCASRNPGFYTNLSNQNNVLHIAIHPSSPYSNCLLNKHNKEENDARTNFYGIYGATPRLVIQGQVIDGTADYDNQSLFTPFLQQTSPIQITTAIADDSATMLKVQVTLKTIAAHSLGNLLLTTSVVEELLNYVGPNGEQQQHDVFRKSCFGVNGQSFNAPAAIGDSIVFTASIAKHNEWDLSQLYALSMVQEDLSKQMVQAARSPRLMPYTGIAESPEMDISLFPNPTNSDLTIKLAEPLTTQIVVYSANGQVLLKTEMYKESVINTSGFQNGLYFVQLCNATGSMVKKITIAH